MTERFEFEDAGRVFTCSAEVTRSGGPPGAIPDAWWWFCVSTDTRQQRYAPFRCATGDTPSNVQSRVVAYWDELVIRRAQPNLTHWGRRGRPAGTP